MPTDLVQSAVWPGVVAVESCQYVCSHGISPGRAVLVTYPQLAVPLEFGTLAFADGRGNVRIPDCKVERITPQISAAGITFTLEIVDARWKWLGLGGISGRYNQRDTRGKLVPWSIKSPSELAGICLKAMGVENAVVELPQGLAAAAGKDVNRYLKLGENYPQTLTNPEVVWEHTAPAEALAQLAEMYGCRVIYQPNYNRVLVTTLGKGVPFPSLPAEVIGATIDGQKAPAFVGVFGAPVKIQARFLLEAVGEEWDGSYLPINQLSYSPVMPDSPQVSRVKETGVGTGLPVQVQIAYAQVDGTPAIAAFVSSPGGTNAAKFADIRAKMAADPTFNAAVTSVADATGITLTGTKPGAFSIDVIDPSTGDDSAWAASALLTPGAKGEKSWAWSQPPLFLNVQATDRLSYTEAKALAQKSVFRCYRILNRDPHDQGPRDKPGRPMVLPWWGKIARRQQILLQETKVAQVIPQGRIPGAINKNNGIGLSAKDIPGQGVLPEFYDGFSRDQAATVTGSIHFKIGNANWMFILNPDQTRFNTQRTDRVFVGFSFNQQEQLIVFDEPVYTYQTVGGADAGVGEPVLTLETGCSVLHPDTNQVVRWEEVLAVSGGVAPTAWSYHEDVQVGVIGNYDDDNRLKNFAYADLADAKSRAGYYLRGEASKFQITGGETRKYIGIVPSQPDGYCQQVIWSVGPEGASTTVSGNTEYHPAVPSYPARRRAENLPPNKAAAAANLLERSLWKDIDPTKK